MLIMYHDGRNVVELSNANLPDVLKIKTLTISKILVQLAQEYPDAVLVWCHINLKGQLNVSEIEQLFHHKKLVFSFNPSDGMYLDKSIGYVEESPFIKVSKTVTYATWQMSSWVGGIHSQVVLALEKEILTI